MACGSDLPVRTKRLLNKVDGWRRTEKKAQKGKTDSRGKMCAKILRQPLIHTQRIKKKEKKKRSREVEETVYTARNPVFTSESRSDVGWVTRRNNG